MNQYLLITQLWKNLDILRLSSYKLTGVIGSWTSLMKLFPPDSNENRSNSEETLFFD